MRRNIFGWDLPPGVTQRMIDEQCQDEGPCAGCGNDPYDCTCPECPTCGTTGDPRCYAEHGMTYTTSQLLGQAKVRLANLEAQVDEEKYAIFLLEEKQKEHRNE